MRIRNPFDRLSKNQLIIVLAFLIGGLVIAFLLPASKASANESFTQVTVIPTHEHMVISDHVFQSEYERCNLPSREDLAQMTSTTVEDWGEPYFVNRQIQFNAVSDHNFHIKIQKDQALGEMNSRNRFFLYGDTYVGRGPFYFRCFDSRKLKFNPNVKSICHHGKALLKRATDRTWIKGKYQGHNPSAGYSYTRRTYLPRFFVPRDAQFNWVDENENQDMVLPGYLTLRVPYRSNIAQKDVWIDAFC